MHNVKNQKLMDRFHEFIIMLIFVLGFALPVIIINIMDIMTSINSHGFSASALWGGV